MNDSYDVIQVGYGPVGQALAALLGRQGHRVLVLERHHGLFAMPRAGHVDDEIMRMLQSLGLASELERVFQPATVYQMLNGSGDLLMEIHGGGHGPSGWLTDYTMAQPDLETALDGAARACPSVDIQQGIEVVALRQDGEGVTVVGRDDDGREHEWRGRYVVGVDGANSFVRRAAGITMTDFGFEAAWLVLDVALHDPGQVLVDAVDGSVLIDGRQWCDPTRPISAFRWIGRKRSRWEIMLLSGETSAEMESSEFHWSFLQRWGVTPDNADVVRHAVYTFRSLLADSWRDARILLAGDAAHSMPPFLGQGLCSGFRDALNLAAKLDLVLARGADVGVLDTYELERSAQARQVIELSMGIGAVVCERDPEAAARRDAMFLSGKRPPPPKLAALRDGIVHRSAAGTPAPGAGTLSVQARVGTPEATSLLDDIVGPGWQLVTTAPVPADLLEASHHALLERLGAQIVHVSRGGGLGALIDVDARYDAWFRSLEAEAVIVRPDFYVFGAAMMRDLPALLDDLARQLPGVLAAASVTA